MTVNFFCYNFLLIFFYKFKYNTFFVLETVFFFFVIELRFFFLSSLEKTADLVFKQVFHFFKKCSLISILFITLLFLALIQMLFAIFIWFSFLFSRVCYEEFRCTLNLLNWIFYSWVIVFLFIFSFLVFLFLFCLILVILLKTGF